MKHLGKMLTGIVAALASVAMAFALAPAALAETQHTITINEPNGQQASHTYEAYQVFKGTYDSNSKQLTGITWGSGVDGDALLRDLKADSTIGGSFDQATDAPTAAAAMAGITSGSANAEVLAKVVAKHLTTTKYSTVDNGQKTDKITVDSDGYYFIKDVTESLSNGNTYSKFMLEVAGGDVTITAKDSTTTSNKHVKETNDSVADTAEEKAGWRSVADYDMGDQVPFQLTGQVAADYGDYDTYHFEFDDTYNPDQLGVAQNVKVFVKGKQLNAADYTLTQNDGSFKVVLNDLKKIVDEHGTPIVHPGDDISVEYTAELLTGANIGSAGNVNTSHITFSNNPNNKDSKGTTPDHTTKVFTYKLVVKKVNEAQNPLSGADFTLYKLDRSDGTYKEVPTQVDGVDLKTVEKGTTFTFKGLDEGNYKLVETTTPKGYNTMADVLFTIQSTTDDDAQTLKGLSGDVTGGTAEFTPSVADGSLTTTIQNNSGSILPSTGGMGTTVLYVGGAVLAVVACVGLAIRHNKRQNA
ncbi:SpaA isopeptide-forming pilin-related protein [Olsenella porci]|uniref:Isopeptide-forming domain-containing fimbrial protein n=1 Tax=Olsenella porci TaxID=2652279 RepID=A0A6N7XBQ9_9ACTN|nr:SpaA isopeptide-forming pilin-related protein [Olsenella porci]MST72777.1 isopeptide-forming domain-containing fimbrial protein [Olsenella porci]